MIELGFSMCCLHIPVIASFVSVAMPVVTVCNKKNLIITRIILKQSTFNHLCFLYYLCIKI